MTNTYRALCAELADSLENARRIIKGADGTLHINTAEFVLRRARAALAEPEAEGPSDEDLYDLAEVFNDDPVPAMRRALELWGRPAAEPAPEPGPKERPRELQWPASVAQGCHEAAAEAESGSPLQQLLVAAGDLLERGRPAAAPPVPVSERLPGPEDCTAQGWCWVFYKGFATWTLQPPLGRDGKHTGYTQWLPANALPTPEATNG